MSLRPTACARLRRSLPGRVPGGRMLTGIGLLGIGLLGIGAALAACGAPSAPAFPAPFYREAVERSLPSGFAAWHSEHFVVVSNAASPDERALAERIFGDAEILHGIHARRFPTEAALAAVSEIRFYADYDSFLAAGAPRGSGGQWIGSENRLEIVRLPDDLLARRPILRRFGPLANLYHEGLHRYLWFACEEIAPAPWLGEGYGDWYAGCSLDREAGSVASVEPNVLRAGPGRIAARDLTGSSLERLLGLEQRAFLEPRFRERNYALAWAVVWFLEVQRSDPEPGPFADLPDRYLAALRKAWRELRPGIARGVDPEEARTEARARARTEAFAGVDLEVLAAAIRAFFEEPAGTSAAEARPSLPSVDK